MAGRPEELSASYAWFKENFQDIRPILAFLDALHYKKQPMFKHFYATKTGKLQQIVLICHEILDEELFGKFPVNTVNYVIL